MLTELSVKSAEPTKFKDLGARVLAGEVVVIRQALQQTELMDLLIEATHSGISKSVGQPASDQARKDGFHRIHEWVGAGDIPRLTDAVYDEIGPHAPEFLDNFMTTMFPEADNFYYEEKPNVRFHIPYDIAEAHKKEFNKFAKAHGQGKIAAHGPHRDSWLDCPSNGMNLWFAVGRIRQGNGLTVFPEDYKGAHNYQKSGNISDGEKLHKALTFDLEPGDVVIFHTDHVHGSVLNRLNETRFAISFRLSLDKPKFPNLHYHSYVHSGWGKSSVLRGVSGVPAMVQSSYLRSFAKRLRNKLIPSSAPGDPTPNSAEIIGRIVDDHIEVALADVAVGDVRGISAALCVARLSETKVVAVTRRCPHAGGDLANGWVDGESIVCPWHNLPYNSKTGRSDCKSLPALKVIKAEISGDRILVYPKSPVLNKELDQALA
ncbi:MAG: Rieske 2Fe-2S domain-containing protein [Paracoccaceae bacterium]